MIHDTDTLTPFTINSAAGGRRVPVILDSPHSWRAYPADFAPVAAEAELLTSWDAWVDELFGAAPSLGAAMLVARFPRFYLDLNRARDDIDPALVAGDMPFEARPGNKSAVGMGLLRRLALPDVPVYPAPLPAAEVLRRIETCYDPYYTALGGLMDDTHAAFGRVVHLDCHSMKSRGNAMNDDPGAQRPDIVVSDRDGTTADPELTRLLAGLFEAQGLKTTINWPYKGGQLIRRFSDPARGRHAIQIELNRGLYMDEARFEKKEPGFSSLRGQITNVLRDFIAAI